MGNSIFSLAATGEHCVDHPLEFPDINVPKLLKKHGIKPNKSLGQNFLIDPSALQRVIDAGCITKEDNILEVGAGLGNLTKLLGKYANEVIAVELDSDLLPILLDVTNSFENVHIVQGDILRLDPVQLMPPGGYLVVANIPYYITSNLIRHLLETKNRPARIVLTVQREVAERICAKPGKLSLLGLSVQIYGNTQIVSHIPAGAFYPVPKVDSAIVRIEIFPSPIIPAEQINTFFQLTKAGFSQKRKMLRNSLSAGIHQDPDQTEKLLNEAGIYPQRRAETLSIDEWKSLTSLYFTSIKVSPEFDNNQ
jgi:16S rRNA (adenine1518-N6/adenine1519-N6)-dimethyltransferase